MRKLALMLINCFIIVFILVLLLHDPSCLAAEAAATNEDADDNARSNEVEISVFKTRAEADKLAEKIGTSGFETLVREHKDKEGATVYGVYVVVHVGTPAAGQRPAAETGMTGNNIFSRTAGYLHGDLTVSEIYTDNAFNTNTDKKSNLGTVFSPGIWISVPRINEKPDGLRPIAPRAPGGLLLSRERTDIGRRYQAYLLFHSDIPLHSENSPSGNTTTYTVQEGIAYNFPFGLSVRVNDEFSRGYEKTDAPLALQPGQVDRYKSNLIYALLSYDTRNRLRLRFDYSHFSLRYDDERNESRDRTDDILSTYLYYKLKPKTSLFAQYEFVDIGYEHDTTLDSRENNFFLGVEWELTAKSKGSLKGGYGIRDFANTTVGSKTFIFEAEVDHRFTPKTSLTLVASRQIEETNIPSTDYVLTNVFRANYQQMLTSKITGHLDFSYANEKYGADLTSEDLTAKRRDNYYEAAFGFQYEFRKWLKAGASYIYSIRDSNFSDFNYTSNTLYFRVTGAL